MTEAEWLSSDDPAKMLAWLLPDGEVSGRSSVGITDRKLSLWAAACWRLLTPHTPIHEARALDVEAGIRDWQSMVKDLFLSSEYSEAHDIVCRRLCPTWAALLRCVVGNPWRPVTSPYDHLDVDGSVDPWLTPTVVHLAAGIYEDRAWERLPILADAPEEAGCPREVACEHCDGKGYTPQLNDIGGTYRWTCRMGCKSTGRVPHPLLAALRGPGPWCRGFWALDLLLGKE